VSTPPDAFSDENSAQEAPEGQEGQESQQDQRDPELLASEEQPTAATQGKEQPSPQETGLPPEAQGETHGGPLGCCLGTVAGIFLMALLTTGIPLLLTQHRPSEAIALPLSLVAGIVCGIIGWQIGKRIYREYELSPRQKQKLAAWEKRRSEQLARKSKRNH
jgi:hypothetical protein